MKPFACSLIAAVVLSAAACDDDPPPVLPGGGCVSGAPCECPDGTTGRTWCDPYHCDCEVLQRIADQPVDAGQAPPAEDATTPVRTDAAAPQTPASFGTTEDEARRTCEYTAIEDITSCEFRAGGRTLDNGARVDVLELEADDPTMAEVKTAFLIIRTPEDPELPADEELASSHSVPGEDVDYLLGPLRVDGTTVSIRVTVISQTHPNTGYPDEDPGTITERDVTTVECTPHDGLYECVRESE